MSAVKISTFLRFTGEMPQKCGTMKNFSGSVITDNPGKPIDSQRL